MKTGAEVIRKGIDLIVLVDLDGLLGGVADNVAVVAPSKVFLELRLELRIHRTVEKIVQLLQKLFAGHGCLRPDIMRILRTTPEREKLPGAVIPLLGLKVPAETLA
mgnify:CR=1 FL=1